LPDELFTESSGTGLAARGRGRFQWQA